MDHSLLFNTDDQYQVESELKKAEELAYINPEIADQEKLKGNDW